MSIDETQRKLDITQIDAFKHDEFVEDQVRDFSNLALAGVGEGVIVDVGGGVGYFALSLATRLKCPVWMIDADPGSVEDARRHGVNAEVGDALAPTIRGDGDVVCFNLILHHLIDSNEAGTRALEVKALNVWRGKAQAVFVNEYIYRSFVGTASGALIYAITSNAFLSAILKYVGKIIPAFRANTFGVGVRFRAREEWVTLFAEAGYRVVNTQIGAPQPVSLPWRGLLIKTIRRDRFLLEALPA
jgi:hypothetical protein